MADTIQKIYNVWDFVPRDDVLIGTFATKKAAEECLTFKIAENSLYNDSSVRKNHHFKILECVPDETGLPLQKEFNLHRQEIIDQRFEFRIPKE